MDRLRNTPPSEVAGRKVVSVNNADGVKFLLDDNSWLLLRASGTEPLLRAYMEATSEEGVAALKVAAHALAPDGVDVTH
jgi:phosphomannomutase